MSEPMEIITRFARKQRGGRYACPRCGKDRMAEDVVHNALSRAADVQVCDCCGTAEALAAMVKEPDPLTRWAVVITPGKFGMVESCGDGIEIDGHYGTWYVIDEGDFDWTPDTPEGPQTIRHHLYLLEHEEYGDEAAGLIVDGLGDIVLDDVWNGFDDLEEVGWARAEGEDK